MTTHHAEEWRPIPGWEGWYSISNLGRVRRDAPGKGTAVGRLLKPANIQGYQAVTLSRDGKTFRRTVHVFVARAFLGKPPSGYEVNHKDGDRWNPAVSNLEYTTHRDNILHSRRILGHNRGSKCWLAKLTEQQAADIIALYARGVIPSEIAPRFGVTASAVCSIASGRVWGHVNTQDTEALRSRAKQKRLKLTSDDVIEIWAMVSRGVRQGIIAERFGIHQSHVSKLAGMKRRVA